MTKKYYLTTPLYYVNSKPHIGHSYTNIAADVLARWHRMIGQEVKFLTGTDEHGQKVDKAARDAGITPQEFTDKISLTFRDLWKTLNIEYDDFIRTTEKRHVQAVQEVWKKLNEKGEIYRDKYSGWYCTPDETFWTEGQILREEGKILCPDCKRPVKRLEEENFFLKLSKHQSWLIETIRKGSEIKILPETRRNEVLGFLENNSLQDLCISRPKSRLEWGIQSPVSEAHVTYVWFDALINYISACGYPDKKKMENLWPADVHIIGKDILRHHAVYWTILLKALELPLPKMIFAHGWWLQGGDKMSKSRGNVTDPTELANKYSVDAYRYFLLSETPFGEDGTFSEEALIKRVNTDLANNLGNLLSRTLAMCEKYFIGEIPSNISLKCQGDLREAVNALPGKLIPLIEKLAFSEALAEIWKLVDRANKFIEEQAPWRLAKENKIEELRFVIVQLHEVLKLVSQAVWLFMPTTGETIWAQLGLSGKPSDILFKENTWGYFEKGGRIAKGSALFPRIEVKN